MLNPAITAVTTASCGCVPTRPRPEICGSSSTSSSACASARCSRHGSQSPGCTCISGDRPHGSAMCRLPECADSGMKWANEQAIPAGHARRRPPTPHESRSCCEPGDTGNPPHAHSDRALHVNCPPIFLNNTASYPRSGRHHSREQRHRSNLQDDNPPYADAERGASTESQTLRLELPLCAMLLPRMANGWPLKSRPSCSSKR